MLLEEVFKQAGVPGVTFVEPQRYADLKVSIRTPGRCCVLEGPSGIGKTTSVKRIIDDLGYGDKVAFLSARRQDDLDYIKELPLLGGVGIVIVDDFHRLDDETKSRLADYMKVLADDGSDETKIILIGINKAGDHLVSYGSDAGLRIDVFKLESNPRFKVIELISRGENALNISIPEKEAIADLSQGSFQIAQMLCHQICLLDNITESKVSHVQLSSSLEAVVDVVMSDLRRLFGKPCIEFARGSKLRREGRAPYLHILKWLRDGNDWSIDLREMVKVNKEHRGSVGQVVDKGHLESILRDKADILEDYFHYQPESSVFSTEDPRLIFYLKTVNWRNFAREVGYTTNFFQGNFDIALSFAGDDRDVAYRIAEKLKGREVSVFYDADEQHRIVAEKIEDYLAPIYRTEAAYVVPLLSEYYPNRIWTRFESEQFKGRFGENAVIPVRFYSAKDSYYNESHQYGSVSFSREKDFETECDKIVGIICKRLSEDRENAEDIED